MKRKVILPLTCAALLLTSPGFVRAGDFPWEFGSPRGSDALAPRDGWGELHQGKNLNETDFAPRYHWRAIYYIKAKEQLMVQPAYVGALQRDLKRLGYYCGAIDGIYSDAVSDAIAQLQKNYSMRVTGTLTDPVRRALNLP